MLKHERLFKIKRVSDGTWAMGPEEEEEGRYAALLSFVHEGYLSVSA